jgi:hypothetical protein
MAILPLKTTGNRLQNTSCLDLMNRPPFLLANFFLSQIVLSKATKREQFKNFGKKERLEVEKNTKTLFVIFGAASYEKLHDTLLW